jgi:hypothetical protein
MLKADSLLISGSVPGVDAYREVELTTLGFFLCLRCNRLTG